MCFPNELSPHASPPNGRQKLLEKAKEAMRLCERNASGFGARGGIMRYKADRGR